MGCYSFFLLRYTYEVAPVFTLIEQAILKHFYSLVGYENGDGTFSPGDYELFGLHILELKVFATS